MRTLFYLVTLLTLHNNHAARILGLFAHWGRSHHMFFEPFLHKLVERGHHVTSISFYPLKDPPRANYSHVSIKDISTLGLESIDMNRFENSNKVLQLLNLERILHQMWVYNPIDEFALRVCKKLVDWPGVAETMKQPYDLVITEYFNSDCFLGLMHIYEVKAPVMALSSNGRMPWAADRIGLEDNPAYVPLISTAFTNKMDFWERLENTFLQVYLKYWYRTSIQMKEQEIIEKHFGRRIPDLRDLGKKVSLILINSHYSLNGVKPLLPGFVEVSGIHLQHTNRPIPQMGNYGTLHCAWPDTHLTTFLQLSQYMERFINESEHGVIFISLGSLIKTATLPKHKEEMIVNACVKLKSRVIWKYENSGEEGTLTGNILRVRWVPQFELLKHPKVLAFVTHGGMLSMTEALYAGKPMVVMPFFGDQPLNAAAAKSVGIGTIVSYANLNDRELAQAMQKSSSAEMRRRAKLVSQIWKDRLADPMDTAIYWTERLIRWGHTDPLHSPARDLSYIQLALLDVIATFLAVIVLLFLALKFLISQVLKFLVMSPKKQKVH